MKNCPYCDEKIQDEALLCQFCNSPIEDEDEEELQWTIDEAIKEDETFSYSDIEGKKENKSNKSPSKSNKSPNFIMTTENNKKDSETQTFKQLMRSSRLITSRLIMQSSSFREEASEVSPIDKREEKGSLKPCLDCGKEISESAPSCPSCGRPNPTIEIKKTGKLKFSRKAEEQAMLVGGQLSVCDSFERLMNGETVMLDLPIGKHILKYNLAQASGTQEINIIKDKTLNIEASVGGLITPKIIFDNKYTS